MKQPTFLLVVMLAFSVNCYAAEKPKQHDPNPTKDPDVQRGFDQHQKEIKEKREGDKRESEGKIREPFDVKKSHEGRPGNK